MLVESGFSSTVSFSRERERERELIALPRLFLAV
jgi:hypothetical protein